MIPTPPTIPEILGILTPVLQAFLFGMGPIMLVIALIFAGYTRLTAADNPKKVQQANATIMWAVAGYAVILLSFFIIRFVATLLGWDGVGDTVDVTL